MGKLNEFFKIILVVSGLITLIDLDCSALEEIGFFVLSDILKIRLLWETNLR
jgi:hypothetical protein